MSDGADAKPEGATTSEEPVSAPACDHSRAPLQLDDSAQHTELL